MWILAALAAVVVLLGSSGSTTSQTRSRSIGPDRRTADLYAALCELWQEGIYDPEALQLGTAIVLRPSESEKWRALARGERAGTAEDLIWWRFVGDVAREVAARPSVLCKVGG